MARKVQGTVVSDAGNQTITVAVSSRKTHPIYKKQYSVTKKFMAHDAKEDAKVGDTVEIEECRPISARKRFTLTRVIERAGVEHIGEADAAEVEKVAGIAGDEQEEDV